MVDAGDVAIALTNERGLDVPVKTVDNKDNTFRIEFEPTTVGTYTANVFFADQEIPSSPYRIQVEPTIDVGRVMVQGLDDSMYLLILLQVICNKLFCLLHVYFIITVLQYLNLL